MHIIIWQYHVKADHVSEFEKIYASDGTWAALLKKGDGFLGTELARHHENPSRCLTIDRWTSRDAYESFKAKYSEEYNALDARCEELTEMERLIGGFETEDLQ
jgi:heme-degrading monooxygenase HmoA